MQGPHNAPDVPLSRANLQFGSNTSPNSITNENPDQTQGPSKTNYVQPCRNSAVVPEIRFSPSVEEDPMTSWNLLLRILETNARSQWDFAELWAMSGGTLLDKIWVSQMLWPLKIFLADP
jgi:hypothetical protein